MEPFPVSRRKLSTPRADTRIPETSASLRNPDPARDTSGDRSDAGKFLRNRNRSFFLTPLEFNNPGFGISLDPTLETGLGPKPGEAVQLAESRLGFHKSQNNIAFCPNVSSFQRAFTLYKCLIFTH